MRILYKDVNAISQCMSAAEILSADEIYNCEAILDEKCFDEIPDLPGIILTCSTFSIHDNQVKYDTIFIVCKDSSVADDIMIDISKLNCVATYDYECHAIFNPEPQELYDLLKASGDQWGC